QRIQLTGPSQYSVRAMAQVDDGAMHNCIGLHIWNSYGHCLGTLTPTTLRVSIANNQTIPCTGLWSGEVSIGGTRFHTHFAVEDCKMAFNVILGKLWLEEVDATHHCKTDTITINTNPTRIVIDNKEHTTDAIPDPAPTSSIVPENRPIDNIPTMKKTLDKLPAEEAVR